MNKAFFKFAFFNELQTGDVFKFSPVVGSDIPSKFYTVYAKDETATKASSTYGKKIEWIEFTTGSNKEVMIFPDRKR